jgi:hypothetical protein
MILRFSLDHRSHLLQWYDERVFSVSKESASARSATTSQNGYGDIDDLIDQLNGAGVTPSSHQPNSAPPGLATVPSSPISDMAVEDETRGVPNAEPVCVDIGAEAIRGSGRKRAARVRGRPVQTRSKGSKKA